MGVSDRVMGNANVAYIVASTYAEPERSVDILDATIVSFGIDPNMLVSRGQTMAVTTVARFDSVLAATVGNKK
jgi:hypothetical protein